MNFVFIIVFVLYKGFIVTNTEGLQHNLLAFMIEYLIEHVVPLYCVMECYTIYFFSLFSAPQMVSIVSYSVLTARSSQ